jgi:ABC-type uncharacterized transport system substrate-binding protein
MGAVGDPLGSGLVTNLARPGGNVTGLSSMAPDLGGKRLELLKEILPKISRVAVLWNSANPYSANSFRETKNAAQLLGIDIHSLGIERPDEVGSALVAIASQHSDALITVEDPFTIDSRRQIAEFAAAQRIPAIYGVREFVDAGGLISYGAQLADLFRRAAIYADKILKGTNPGDLPVEQPNKFELVINLDAARKIGLEIPPTLLSGPTR